MRNIFLSALKQTATNVVAVEHQVDRMRTQLTESLSTHAQFDTDDKAQLLKLSRALKQIDAKIHTMLEGRVAPEELLCWVVYMPGNGYYAGGMSWVKHQAKARRYTQVGAIMKAADWTSTEAVRIGAAPVVTDPNAHGGPKVLREMLSLKKR